MNDTETRHGRTRLRTDVVVVGAGLAGLAAARAVAAAGRSVVVLEARDRVGGRTLSEPVGPAQWDAVDLGAQWVTTPQRRIHELAREHGIPVFDCHHEGADVVIADGETAVAPPEPAPAEVREAVRRLDAMAESVPVEAPWAAAHVAEWDRMSLGTWLERELPDPEVRAWITDPAELYFAVPVYQVPLLHALFYARGNGGFGYLVGEEGLPSNQRSIAGGSQRLAIALAEGLGERVILHTRVDQIVWNHDGAEVSGGAVRVDAGRVIVALAPALTARIDYHPALPVTRDHLCQRFPLGTGWKFQTVYDEPFWRSEGRSGRLVDMDRSLDVYDGSPVDSRVGALVVFNYIEETWRLAAMTPERRRTTVLDSLVQGFGARAARPKHFLEKMWGQEPLSRGEVSVPTLGAWSAFGQALREPVGPLHWAGTETATEFPGQMEGAIRSGERAAREVLSGLLDDGTTTGASAGPPGRTQAWT